MTNELPTAISALPKRHRREVVLAARRELARQDLLYFTKQTKSDYQIKWFHEILLHELNLFASGQTQKLMIFMPPQHGKSELVSRRLPAFVLGTNPNLRLVGASYSADLARAFNRDVQRIIDSEEYAEIFPGTRLNSKNLTTDAKGSYLRNADKFEVVGHKGFYKSVGVGGPLTGTSVDVGIIDDPVKDAAQADSPTFRMRVWEWYEQVFSTRLHNDSQQLLTMTRWHQDDLAGRILASKDAENWRIVKLPAIFEGTRHHPLDLREIGEALWPEKHSESKIKMGSERTFRALMQQDPMPPKGGLIFPDFLRIDAMPEGLRKVAIGLDFGYANDPTAAIMCGVKGDTIYLDQIIYQTGLVNSEIASLLPKRFDVFCDSSEPKSCEELRRAGAVRAKAVKKAPGSILAGLALLREYKIAITARSFGLFSEQQKYVYKTDGYGNPTNDPIDAFNHAWDAVRYWALSALSKSETNFWV